MVTTTWVPGSVGIVDIIDLVLGSKLIIFSVLLQHQPNKSGSAAPQLTEPQTHLT